MKRISAALLAIAALVMLAAPAFADVGWRTTELGWRFHRIDGTSAAYSFKRADVIGPYADSVAFNRVGSGGTTMSVANAETSTVISTEGWAYQNRSAVADSPVVARVFIYDAGSTAASVDSLYLAVQASPDGYHWVYMSQVVGVVGTNPVTNSTPAVSAIPLLNSAGTTTSTPKVFTFAFNSYPLGSGSNFPDRSNITTWPYLRFIVCNKLVGGVQHNLKIKVRHLSATCEQ